MGQSKEEVGLYLTLHKWVKKVWMDLGRRTEER